MICLRITNSEKKRLIDSFPSEFETPEQDQQRDSQVRYIRKNIESTADIAVLEILLTEESRIANSNKVFNSFVTTLEVAVRGFMELSGGVAKAMADDYLHNVIKIHGNQKSIIERCVSRAEGSSLTYKDFIDAVKSDIQTRPEVFADDICALSQEIRLIDYHIGGYKLLRDKHTRISITDNHNLRKFLLGLSHLFFDTFKKKGVILSLHSLDDSFHTSFEYETFNIAMHSFLENAVKYSRPYSKITVNLERDISRLVFEMESVRIEKHELETILERGTYGVNVPEDLKGTGIGMYQLKTALERSGIAFSITPDHSRSWELDGVRYTRNLFSFDFNS